MVSAFVLRLLSLTFVASFVAQVAALGSSCSAPLTPGASASDPFWLQSITKRGTSAFNSNPSAYKVFRNVKDYGAKGDGSTDDTAAINRAISDGNRCGNGCHSSTLSPALIYFPSGTYIVSTPIIPFYYTSLVGDRKNLPTIKATANFNGIAIIDADPYLAGGAQYYTTRTVLHEDTLMIVSSCLRHFNTDVHKRGCLSNLPVEPSAAGPSRDISGVEDEVADRATMERSIWFGRVA